MTDLPPTSTLEVLAWFRKEIIEPVEGLKDSIDELKHEKSEIHKTLQQEIADLKKVISVHMDGHREYVEKVRKRRARAWLWTKATVGAVFLPLLLAVLSRIFGVGPLS